MTASESFQAAGGKLWFTKYPGIDAFVLDPIDRISIGHLLIANFSLRSMHLNRVVTRAHKPIIVLAKFDGATSFREVSRVSLNKQLMLLCHHSWADQAEGHLGRFCISGFEKHEAKSIQGIPEGWVLFSNVVFNSTILEEADAGITDQLAALVPLDDGQGIHLEGGLKLNNNSWHSSFLPRCYANDERGVIACKLMTRSLQGGGEPIAQQDEPININFLSDAIDRRARAQYVITAERGRKKYTRDIAVRSADSPRPSVQQMRRSVSGGIVSETVCASADARFFCEGMYLAADSVPPDFHAHLVPPATIQSEGASHDDMFGRANYLEADATQSSEVCAVRGYHIWVCEPYDGKRSRALPVKMTCSGCNVSVLSKGKGKRKASNRLASRARALPISLPSALAATTERHAIKKKLVMRFLHRRGQQKSARTNSGIRRCGLLNGVTGFVTLKITAISIAICERWIDSDGGCDAPLPFKPRMSFCRAFDTSAGRRSGGSLKSELHVAR